MKKRPYYITIYQDVLNYIAAVSLKWGCIETGGEFYGLFTHAGRFVIMLATPPGENSIHEKAHFRPDIEFLVENNKYIRESYGLQYLGAYHSHHLLELHSPSSIDDKNTHKTARRNNYRKLVQFILTFQHKTSSENTVPAVCVQNCTQLYEVKINSFFYSNAKFGRHISCPLRVLPFKSPFQHDIKKKYYNLVGGLLEVNPRNIIYDSYQTDTATIISRDAIPWSIQTQLNLFPTNLQDATSINICKDFIILSIPNFISYDVVFYFAFTAESPHTLKRVFSKNLNDGISETVDITKDCTNQINYSLFSIYKEAVTVHNKKNIKVTIK